MSATSDPAAGRRTLLKWLLLCISLCLLFTLTPNTDIDLDGESDSFATDSLLLIPGLPAAIIPFLLSRASLSPLPDSPKQFAAVIVPPPIL